MTREVIRTGARAIWPRQGWNLTIAVHAVNMCKVLEDFDGARAIFEREYDEAVRAGAPVLMSGLAVAYADVLLRLGRLEEALELVDRTSALIDRQIRPWTDLAAAVLCTELGLEERAQTHIEALRAFRRGDARRAVLDRLAVAGAARRPRGAGGRPPRGGLRHDGARRRDRDAGRAPRAVPGAVGGGRRRGAPGRRARRSRASAARRARDALGDAAEPLAARRSWRSGAPRSRRSTAIARRPTRASRRRSSASGSSRQPLELAQALIGFGAHLRRTGRPREAREPLARAVAICEDAGAQRLARAARAELAASGGRRRRRGDDSSVLTAQETRVAALAAEGLANAQIAAALHLSPKTVGFHLQRVYAKLEIHSRRELIRRAGEFTSRAIERAPERR